MLMPLSRRCQDASRAQQDCTYCTMGAFKDELSCFWGVSSLARRACSPSKNTYTCVERMHVPPHSPSTPMPIIHCQCLGPLTPHVPQHGRRKCWTHHALHQHPRTQPCQAILNLPCCTFHRDLHGTRQGCWPHMPGHRAAFEPFQRCPSQCMQTGKLSQVEERNEVHCQSGIAQMLNAMLVNQGGTQRKHFRPHGHGEARRPIACSSENLLTV